MEETNKKTNIKSLVAKKIKQTQRFDEKNYRIPVTELEVGPCTVIQIKKTAVDGYNSLQLGFGLKKDKSVTKPLQGHTKKAGIQKNPLVLKEIRVDNDEVLGDITVGKTIKVDEIFSQGDTIDVTGISKGRGFTGVVKRHHFKGGPRTHGQSDRERAPGSIGQTTTPGRVYKGKRMAGRSGQNRITVKNLKVVEVNAEKNSMIIKGLVPGKPNSVLIISKIN